MQKLVVLQSIWAMERRHTDGFEPSLESNLRQIATAGFDGVSALYRTRTEAAQVFDLLRGTGLVIEGIAFPRTIEDLRGPLEAAAEFPVLHLNVQPDVRPRTVAECVPLLEGWMRLAEEAGVRILIETHRDRMTTDLYFTLDLLQRLPDLPLLADLSHYLVGREFPWPVSDENHALIHRILDNSWAIHGRVASREQVQIEIGYAHHRPWVDLFTDWWAYGFRSWRRRAGPDDVLSFVCELGPKPYAITGPDGNDTVDRWSEALVLAALVRELWGRTKE